MVDWTYYWQDQFPDSIMTIVRCVHEAAVDQDDSIKMFAHNIPKIESNMASEPRCFFMVDQNIDYAQGNWFDQKGSAVKGSYQKGFRLGKNVVFAMSLRLTLMEIAEMIAEMRRLPPDHEYHHK